MLVAFAGFGGAGKTTAIEVLQQQGLGRRVYLGEAVFDEIRNRGLVRTAELERAIRVELRATLGPSAFADLRAPQIVELMRNGECALIDAIFKIEEYKRLEICGQRKSVLVGIEASFQIRAERLKTRGDRGYSVEELRLRDQTEREDLGTASVLKAADFTISNESSLIDFGRRISDLWRQVAVRP